jgi:hypothetical protein
MRSTIITATIIVLAGFTACTSTESSDLLVKTAGKEKSKEKDAPAAFNFSEARPIDSTDFVLYPLTITANSEEEDEYGGLYKSSSRGTQYYRNIIFYNIVSKKYHLLDNRKMLITSYSVGEEPDDYTTKSSGEPLPHLIYYKVIVNDYNGDGKLGGADPEYLFISDLEGSYFKQISPDNLSVAGWKDVTEKGKVLIELTEDANGDKKFEYEGNSIPYVYDIKSGTIAAPVFSKGFTDSVSNVLKEQWAKKEK